MAAADRIHGKLGQVKLEKTGAATGGTVVASLNKWTLSLATDKVDVTAFQDTNKIYVTGLPDIKGTIGGWYDKTDKALFQMALGTVAGFLELIPSSLTPTDLWHGLAWIDASIDVAANGAVSIAGTFVAAGPWAMLPTIP
jgi:hypothetical protein